MAKYIDAEKLEKDGWSASRTYQQDAKTMVYETKKMTDFPATDVVDKERYDRLIENSTIIAEALRMYQSTDMVEVVRCKDCIYGKSANDGTVFCRADTIHVQSVWRPQNWFCASGKRNEDE